MPKVAVCFVAPSGESCRVASSMVPPSCERGQTLGVTPENGIPSGGGKNNLVLSENAGAAIEGAKAVTPAKVANGLPKKAVDGDVTEGLVVNGS